MKDYIKLNLYGGATQYTTSYLHPHDQFGPIADFLGNKLIAYLDTCQKQQFDIIIFPDGTVTVDKQIESINPRWMHNKIIQTMRSVRQISNINNFYSAYKDIQFHPIVIENEYIEQLIDEFDTYNLIPEFRGIALSIIPSNRFVKPTTFIELVGPDADTFYNAKTLII